MDIFNLLKKTFPVSTCFLFQDQELADSNLIGSFEGILQEASNELSLEFNGGISHNLFCSLIDFENIEIGKEKLVGYNTIVIDNETFEIIRTQKVKYKEGGHLEILLNKNAS
jgi:hypothetical protein